MTGDSTAVSMAAGVGQLAAARPHRSPVVRALGFARHNVLGAVGALIVLVLVVVAAAAPLLATHDPYRLTRGRLQAPSSAHRFGTDDLGRDVFSRIVYGARISLQVGFVAVSVGIIGGTVIGIVSAYFGGAVDFGIQRVMDGMFAFPTIILALTIVSVLGPSITNVILAVGIVSAPRTARVVRASTLGIMTQPYIDAARATGCSSARIITRHILPNCFAPILVLATVEFGAAVLAEASLSFLGLGAPPPQPSWGSMLSGAAQQYVRVAPWLAVIPGLAISLAVLGFNLFGDALRDTFDPRLRGR